MARTSARGGETGRAFHDDAGIEECLPDGKEFMKFAQVPVPGCVAFPRLHSVSDGYPMG